MKQKSLIFFLLTIVVIFSGCVGNNGNNIQPQSTDSNTTNTDTTQVSVSIVPVSIEKYYTTTPSEYFKKMYELSESMYAVRINIEQNANKTVLDNSIKQFSQEYNDSSNMVPEWIDYYDLDTVQQLAIGNNAQILDSLDSIFNSCTDCHREMKPAVWAKYNWKDLRDIKINTSSGVQNWSVGKIILEEGLNGIDINIKGNRENIKDSYNLFRSMYNNMVDTCTNCHKDTNLKYNDLDMVNNLEKEINSGISSGNFNKVNDMRQQIINDCYNCHLIHETPQRIKEIDQPR